MRYLILFLCVVALPRLAQAAIHITEVAWMGTAESQYSEWLELYNDEGSAVNLAGWKLYEGDGGTLVFTFSKSIPAQGYLLLERTTPSAPDAVPGIDDEAGSFGGSGLANTGEDLVLKDAGGSLVEEFNYLGGWPAGDVQTKKTMQWNGTEWVTATATPKASLEEQEDDGGGEITEETSLSEAEEIGIPKVSPNKPHIEFTVPSTIYRGVSYEYSAQPVFEYNYRIGTGSMYWNLGDGTTVLHDAATPIMHTYEYAGTYTISFLYTDPDNKNPPLKGIKKITVLAPTVALRIVDGRALELTNESSTDTDLSGWKVVASGTSFKIPDLTVLAGKATATIPFIAMNIPVSTTLTLVDPSGSVVAYTGKQAVSVASTPVSLSNQESLFPNNDDLVAYASGSENNESSITPIRNHTKTIVFGAVALFVIGLSILLERVTARREYQEE